MIHKIGNKNVEVDFWRCKVCGHTFTDEQVQYCKLDVLESCPCCHAERKVNPIIKEVTEARDEKD